MLFNYINYSSNVNISTLIGYPRCYLNNSNTRHIRRQNSYLKAVHALSSIYNLRPSLYKNANKNYNVGPTECGEGTPKASEACRHRLSSPQGDVCGHDGSLQHRKVNHLHNHHARVGIQCGMKTCKELFVSIQVHLKLSSPEPNLMVPFLGNSTRIFFLYFCLQFPKESRNQ